MSSLIRVSLAALSSGVLYGANAQIWFAPLDDITRQTGIFVGAIPSSASTTTEFMELFAPGAQWTQAAGHVSVFKMYGEPPFGEMSDSDLQTVFSFLGEHNIELAIEFGPLTPTSGCGTGVEGFNGPGAQTIVNRILTNGGSLKYVAMDEPFYYAEHVCNWSAQQIAMNAIASLNIYRRGSLALSSETSSPSRT
jgi:hypothetical protein